MILKLYIGENSHLCFAGYDTNRFFFIVRDNTVVCLSEYSDEIKSGTYKIRV